MKYSIPRPVQIEAAWTSNHKKIYGAHGTDQIIKSVHNESEKKEVHKEKRF